MSIRFGWWRADAAKLFERLSQLLTFLSAAACIFLITESVRESTDRAKRKDGTRYHLYIHNLYSPRILVWSKFSSLGWNDLINLLLASHVVDLFVIPWRWPRNLVGPDDMFLVTPVPTLKEASLFIFFLSNTNEMHFVGVNVRSRSWQELEISCKALPQSSEVDEMIVTLSANPWTLCGLESPIAAVGFTGRLLVEQYNLSVPQAGYHLRSASLIVSVNSP